MDNYHQEIRELLKRHEDYLRNLLELMFLKLSSHGEDTRLFELAQATYDYYWQVKNETARRTLS